jgi:hypothetical protein
LWLIRIYSKTRIVFKADFSEYSVMVRGLESTLREVEHLHTTRWHRRLPPGERQLALFDGSAPEEMPDLIGARAKLGWFYEVLFAKLLGGIRQGKIWYADPKKKDAVEAANPDIVCPDGSMYDSKASIATNEGGYIKDHQLAGYIRAQTVTRRPVSYIFARHLAEGYSGGATKKKQKQAWDDHTLFSTLADNTPYAVILPLRLVAGLHKAHASGNPAVSAMVSRESPEEISKWIQEYVKPDVRLKARTFNELFADPTRVVGRLGLHPNAFSFERYVTEEGIDVAGYPVKSFPVLWVKDNNYLRWGKFYGREYFRNLREDHLERLSQNRMQADNSEIPF